MATTGLLNSENGLLNQIRNGYYGISDNLIPLIESLEEALFIQPDNKALQHELKTFKNIQATFQNSDIGRVL